MIEKLYESLWGELVGWCASMTGERHLAEELVQEAFVRAMAHQTELSLLESAQRRAWMYRTVKNLFYDRQRRAKRLASLEEMEERGFDIASVSCGIAEIEWEALLSSLPGDEGTLFVLRYLQGWNSAQIGQMFGMPPGTVRSKLASARKHLREMIGGEGNV